MEMFYVFIAFPLCLAVCQCFCFLGLLATSASSSSLIVIYWHFWGIFRLSPNVGKGKRLPLNVDPEDSVVNQIVGVWEQISACQRIWNKWLSGYRDLLLFFRVSFILMGIVFEDDMWYFGGVVIPLTLLLHWCNELSVALPFWMFRNAMRSLC